MDARRSSLALPVTVRVPLPVGASALLFLAYVTCAAWLGDAHQAVAALLVFGGLFLTSVAVTVAHPRKGIGQWVQAGYPLLFWPFLYQGAVDVIMLDRSRYVDPLLMQVDAFVLPWTTALLGGPVEELVVSNIPPSTRAR